jgi:hypothetical protein
MKNNIKFYKSSAISVINLSEIDVILNRIDEDERELNNDKREFQN